MAKRQDLQRMNKLLADGAIFLVPVVAQPPAGGNPVKIYFSALRQKFITGERRALAQLKKDNHVLKGSVRCPTCYAWFRTKNQLESHTRGIAKRNHTLPFPTCWVWIVNGSIVGYANAGQGQGQGGQGIIDEEVEEEAEGMDVEEEEVQGEGELGEGVAVAVIPVGAQRVKVMIINHLNPIGATPLAAAILE